MSENPSILSLPPVLLWLILAIMQYCVAQCSTGGSAPPLLLWRPSKEQSWSRPRLSSISYFHLCSCQAHSALHLETASKPFREPNERFTSSVIHMHDDHCGSTLAGRIDRPLHTCEMFDYNKDKAPSALLQPLFADITDEVKHQSKAFR